MKEGSPRAIKESLSQASMEGTVHMPQIGIGITVFNTERALSEEDPKKMTEALLAPIPDDEVLEKRTARANAQHAHHGIGRLLTIEEVRKIQRIGNLGTINLIGAGLGLHPNLDFNEGRIFDLSGNWATEVVRIRAAKVEELLTPETREIFQSYLLAAKEILESPEIKEKLRQRKELFNGWKEMNPESKRDARNKVNGLSRDITQAIKTGLYMKADELDSKYAQQIAINLAFEFDQMLPRI